MEAPANTVQFFGFFNFLTSVEIAQSMHNLFSLSRLQSYPPHGTGCAYSLGMLNKTENSNIQSGRLPLITAADFQLEVLEPEEPVLVEFWTPWSRACQVFDSVLHEVANACGGKAKLVKVNADESLDLSLLYDIQSVPTLLCFFRGTPCLRIIGTASKEAILAKLKPFFQ